MLFLIGANELFVQRHFCTMDKQQEKKKLRQARKKAKKIAEEIKAIRKKISDAGYDPDENEERTARNKEFYKKWKEGMPVAVIAKGTFLSPERIRVIC